MKRFTNTLGTSAAVLILFCLCTAESCEQNENAVSLSCGEGNWEVNIGDQRQTHPVGTQFFQLYWDTTGATWKFEPAFEANAASVQFFDGHRKLYKVPCSEFALIGTINNGNPEIRFGREAILVPREDRTVYDKREILLTVFNDTVWVFGFTEPIIVNFTANTSGGQELGTVSYDRQGSGNPEKTERVLRQFPWIDLGLCKTPAGAGSTISHTLIGGVTIILVDNIIDPDLKVFSFRVLPQPQWLPNGLILPTDPVCETANTFVKSLSTRTLVEGSLTRAGIRIVNNQYLTIHTLNGITGPIDLNKELIRITFLDGKVKAESNPAPDPRRP